MPDLRIAYTGEGPVHARCEAILRQLKVEYSPFEGDIPPCDLALSVHARRLFTEADLKIPRIGILNLHNSYLPWNRGADACTWAIVDKTPHGVTVHWVDKGIDTGPIFTQAPLEILPGETADQLYKRTADLEVDAFRECVQLIKQGTFARAPQGTKGSFHKKADIHRLINALTTRDLEVVWRKKG